MDEDADVEVDRSLPERVKIELAEIGPLDIGGDDNISVIIVRSC